MKRTFFGGTALFLILALSLAACRGGASQAVATSAARAGDPIAGERIFVSACAACHGPKGEGVQGISKDMTQSESVAGATDQELVEFIKTGRSPGDSRNSTGGVIMPPKGGNPALSDESLVDIVAYIRSLQN